MNKKRYLVRYGVNELSEYNKGYIASFIDTDGSLYLDRKKYPRVAFYNDDKSILEHVYNILGVGNVYEHNGHYKLVVSNLKDVYTILKNVRLVIKEPLRKNYLFWIETKWRNKI